MTVESPEEKCDVVITIYDTDGQTVIKEVDDTFSGEKEYAEWECKSDGVYFARIRQYNPEIYGVGTGYRLSLTQPYMTFDSYIWGVVTPAMETNLTTGFHSARSFSSGYYYMPHRAGDFTLKVLEGRCETFSAAVHVPEIEPARLDVFLVRCEASKGALQVGIDPPEAVTEGANWRVDTGAWQSSAE